jgi:hypothetical protein
MDYWSSQSRKSWTKKSKAVLEEKQQEIAVYKALVERANHFQYAGLICNYIAETKRKAWIENKQTDELITLL